LQDKRLWTLIYAEERKKRNLATEKHGESQRIETRRLTIWELQFTNILPTYLRCNTLPNPDIRGSQQSPNLAQLELRCKREVLSAMVEGRLSHLDGVGDNISRLHTKINS